MLSKSVLTSEDAATAIAASQALARQKGWAVSIAVCDDGGHLLAFVRMPGASPASAGIAQAKARTAALFRRETKGIEDMINGGRTAFLSVPLGEGLLEGGLPFVVAGQCAGAIGISGVKPDEDALVGKTGVEAVLAS
jgi:glc operon protein GlcG